MIDPCTLSITRGQGESRQSAVCPEESQEQEGTCAPCGQDARTPEDDRATGSDACCWWISILSSCTSALSPIRWYGVLMALSIALGFYYLRRDAMKLGYSEDFLYNAVLLAVIGGIIGARAVYVATNWGPMQGLADRHHPD